MELIYNNRRVQRIEVTLPSGGCKKCIFHNSDGGCSVSDGGCSVEDDDELLRIFDCIDIFSKPLKSYHFIYTPQLNSKILIL